MQLSQTDFTVRKTHARNAFELTPPTTTELFSQSPSLADRQVDGDNLNVL